MKDIFQFVKEQEIAYSQEYEVMPNWNWCMKDHVQNSIMLKHGKFITATNELKRKEPYKNIIYPFLNLRYRAEDIDMKDVMLYVDDPESQHLSFLIKKYHDEVYVREHDLDTLFDELKEEKIDLGACLVRKGKDGWVYESLDSIAFCDQTDLLSGPIAFKMFFSPDELYEMEDVGWGDEKNGATITLDELVTLAEDVKEQDKNKQQKTDTPGKYIEVYRIHGAFPKEWMSDTEQVKEKGRYVRQMHIIAFYKNSEGLKTGVTLYRKREYENPFKIHLSGKKIRNRALAFGGVEELIDPQIWTNYSEIQKKNLLDALSKVIRWTDDPAFQNRNEIRDMENNELLTVEKGSQVRTLDVPTANVSLFNEWIREWDVAGQGTSGATEALLGKSPNSGTPFRLEALVAQQGAGLHDYRKGKFATFIAELYTDGIIPDIAKKVTNGITFLASLSPDEMEYVSDCLVRSQTRKYALEKVLNGETFTDEEIEIYKEKIRSDFARGGNKKFLKILEGEFKEKLIRVKVNVAGKQKDLVSVVDKMVNIFRQVLADPTTLEDPKRAKVFNKLVEYSGLDPIDFGYASYQKPQVQPQQQEAAVASPAIA